MHLKSDCVQEVEGEKEYLEDKNELNVCHEGEEERNSRKDGRTAAVI